MLLSTAMGIINKKVTEKEAIQIFKNAGFDAYDMTLCPMIDDDYYLNNDDYREQAKDIREFADSIGIVCNQAHAPFHSSTGDPEEDAKIFEKIVRSMEIASILGAKIIVVHPKQHLTYQEFPEELFRLNVEFYTNLIPYCEKFGIKVACENMWQYNYASKSIIDSTCSRAWEFNKYLDAINSEWIVGCLDIGHISLVDADIPEFIRIMGNKRIQALHVHDTDFVDDLHTIPYTAKIDFHAIAKALAEIDYQGDFTYEAGGFFHNIPKELVQAGANFMCEVGRYIISEIEAAK